MSCISRTMVIMAQLRKLVPLLSLSCLLVACGDDSDAGSQAQDAGSQPRNERPSANAGADQVVPENSSVVLSGSGTDSDGSVTAYSWSQTRGTSVTLQGSDSATASFDAPEVIADEDLTFRLTVTDNEGARDSDTIVITVTNQNQPPTANAGSDQTVDELSNVSLTGSGTDSDGTVATYSWSQSGGTTVSLQNADSATASFDAPDLADDEQLVFELTVTDNEGASDTDSTVVTVTNVVLTAEAYIRRNVPNISGAIDEALSYAAVLETIETVDRNQASARAFLNLLSIHAICLDESLLGSETSSDEVIVEIKTIVLDSDAKITHYLELNSLMGGTVTTLDELRGLASCVQ